MAIIVVFVRAGRLRKENNMDARVTISEDTIKNAGKLSNHQQFALRLERLKKLDESGELAQ